jgi:hypothetical protein
MGQQPKFNINTNNYRVLKNVKISQNFTKNVFEFVGNTDSSGDASPGYVEFDVESIYSSCKLQQGLHFLLWGYYGSPDGVDGEYIKIYDENKIFVDIKPGFLNSNAGVSGTADPFKLLPNEFCIIESSALTYTNSNSGDIFYIDSTRKAASVFVASFFESAKNLKVENNYNTNASDTEAFLDDEGAALVDYRFYPKYEIQDLDLTQLGLDYSYCIGSCTSGPDTPYSFTINSNQNFKYVDLFISVRDASQIDNERGKIYLGNDVFDLPINNVNTTDDNTYILFYKMDLDCSQNIDIKIELEQGCCIQLNKVKVIYHN